MCHPSSFSRIAANSGAFGRHVFRPSRTYRRWTSFFAHGSFYFLSKLGAGFLFPRAVCSLARPLLQESYPSLLSFPGGVRPWAKYQGSDPVLNQLEASFSVHKRADSQGDFSSWLVFG